MNYDWLTWFEYFIGAFACCFGIFMAGKIFLKRKFSDIKFYNYLLLILFSIFLIMNSFVFDNIIKIFGTLIILFFNYKGIYREKAVDSFLYAIVTYIIFSMGEITVAVVFSLIDLIFDFNIMSTITKSYLANIGIAGLVCLYSYLLRKPVVNNINKLNKNNIVSMLLLGIVTIFVIISSIFNLYINKWVINTVFILNTVIIIGCLFLIWVLLKQHLKNKEVTDKYQLLEDYMKTSADLIEKYSTTIHKYKNNLISIKGYIKTDIQTANEYIDNLLDDFKTRKYAWVSKINYIKMDGIRYLIYYKLSKAEELNLKLSINVSKEVEKIESNALNLHKSSIVSDLLGEFFDNAIYASGESSDKELSFDVYKNDKNLVVEISNTYKEEIQMDLITKNGYTTKGTGHGLGLYEADKIIKTFSFLESEYELVDNYFVVRLYIKL